MRFAGIGPPGHRHFPGSAARSVNVRGHDDMQSSLCRALHHGGKSSTELALRGDVCFEAKLSGGGYGPSRRNWQTMHGGEHGKEGYGHDNIQENDASDRTELADVLVWRAVQIPADRRGGFWVDHRQSWRGCRYEIQSVNTINSTRGQ